MAMQTLEKKGLVLSPYSDFFEFIPLEQSLRSREDNRYNPDTVLLDKVVPGEDYEVVITNFYGMAFIRYRVGHFVKFMPNGRPGQGNLLPQFVFTGRADDRIDLAGFTRLDEKTVWEALSLTGLEYESWTIRKEFEADMPILHMYMELKRNHPENKEIEEGLHLKLRQVDPFYGDAETMLGLRPLRITSLPRGTFDRFYANRHMAGLELGKLQPPKMNATDEDIDDLLRAAG